MISYEVSISLIVIPIILLSGSLNLAAIVYKQVITISFIFPLFPLAIIYFISILAETNRVPFDLPEAEAELVAGYNVEFSAFTFAAFFLGEYSNILIMTTMFVIFFLAGSGAMHHRLLYLVVKIIFLCFLFVFIRANLPRFRFDQLMFIG
jgi:NADH-quinone oxidoreductase subunit H